MPGVLEEKGMDPIALTLITRVDCHLCDEMAAVIALVLREVPAALEVRDVDAEPGLRARYGDEVPVLLINGRKAFKYRVGAWELRRRLREEARRAEGRRWWPF